MNDRSVSPLAGIILLFGLVIMGSLLLFLTAAPVVEKAEQASERDRVEQAMVQFNQEIGTATYQDGTPVGQDLDLNKYGAITREGSGNITIESDGLSSDIEATMGAVEWKGEDGTTVASEGGAVFRETGNETRVVAAPRFNYDHQTRTLNFPVINTSGETDLGNGNLEVRQTDVVTYAGQSVVEDDNVTITVESDYCVGWETYFRAEAGDGAIQEGCGNDQTVVAKIGYLDIADAFEVGISHTNEDGYGTQGNPNGPDETQHALMEPIDNEIDQVLNQTLNNQDTTFLNETGATTLDDGLYYVDGIEDGDQYDVNLADGHATLVVAGDLELGDEAITVTNRSGTNVLKIYATGDLEAIEGNTVNYDDSARQDASVIQIFGKSTMQVDFRQGGNIFFEGVIYAPAYDGDWEDRGGQCGEVQACFHSNPDFFGSIVVESAFIQGGEGSTDFQHDEQLDDVDFDVFPADGDFDSPPNLTYLNVVEHNIEVKRR